MLTCKSGSAGGSSCAEPAELLEYNSEVSEIYGAPVIRAPSLPAGVACTSSGCNRCTSVAHIFSFQDLGFLFFLQEKNLPLNSSSLNAHGKDKKK